MNLKSLNEQSAWNRDKPGQYLHGKNNSFTNPTAHYPLIKGEFAKKLPDEKALLTPLAGYYWEREG